MFIKGLHNEKVLIESSTHLEALLEEYLIKKDFGLSLCI